MLLIQLTGDKCWFGWEPAIFNSADCCFTSIKVVDNHVHKVLSNSALEL